MKITTMKCVAHDEILIIQETYEIRVQIKKGLIITLWCDVEDGDHQFWRGKKPADTKIINKLTAQQRTDINNLIYEKGFEDES